MLTHLDDFLNHQIPQSFDHVASPHRNWTEKMWFSTEDTESGEILVVCGIGQYPNRDVQDAFAGASYHGKQYNVRMSRQLRPDIHRMRVGPFSIDVVEGLRTFQLVLDDNPS
ncbi:MAG TPA: hypothetical protein VJB15_08920, partial [Rhodothermia bacterium]|nr:hypothetical protein [Rhodothermia bacterium]